MRTAVCFGAVLFLGGVSAEAAQLTSMRPEFAQLRPHVMCFKKGEETSGFNKICYYDCLGSTAAITISSVELCPLTIQQ